MTSLECSMNLESVSLHLCRVFMSLIESIPRWLMIGSAVINCAVLKFSGVWKCDQFWCLEACGPAKSFPVGFSTYSVVICR